MEGPPRVFSLIKMSVKSLPGNQELDSAGSPCTLVTLQAESARAPQKIKRKKARQVTAYLCRWRVCHLAARHGEAERPSARLSACLSS